MARNPNRMQEATDNLMATFQKSASILVTYKRGSSIAVTDIRATVGRTPFEVMQGEVMTAYESRDYLIDYADLIYDGDVLTPASGDTITEANGSVYEVSIPRGLNVYESIGPMGTVFKIHTKQVV